MTTTTEPRDRSTAAIVVIAKEPAPGRAKTRLHDAYTADEAAELAGAALRDSLRAAESAAAAHKLLYWQGFGGDHRRATHGLSRGFEIADQASGGLADRLSDAFRCARRDHSVDVDHPTLLIGMDTPQVRRHDLEPDWHGVDALLGLARDGGFWAIGLRRGDPARVFEGIPMSTPRTGAAQLARLHDLGLRVGLLTPLTDVDTPADAEHVATRHPALEFSAVHRRIAAGRAVTQNAFDQVYTGGSVQLVDGRDPLRCDPQRWCGAADAVDAVVAARCRGPVLDLGCGPGRLVVHLLDRGIPALGIDISEFAVRAARDRGATTLHRDLQDRLPLEGQWGTVVLLDSNIGIGGDVAALLRRSRDLVAPGGTVLCEVDPDPQADDVCDVVITGHDGGSTTLRWSRAGARAVIAAAECLDLVVTEQWNAHGREFLGLVRT